MIDVSVGCLFEVIEDVLLERYRWFHDECVEVQPPEPKVGLAPLPLCPGSYLSPFSFRVFGHTIPNDVDLLPALSPLVRISFFGAHICQLKIIAPSLRVEPLVSDAVSFYCPFSGTFPIHNASSFVSRKNDNKFAATTQSRAASVSSSYICHSVSHCMLPGRLVTDLLETLPSSESQQRPTLKTQI